MNEDLLTLQDLSKYYTTGQSVTVGLGHIDLAFRRGEFVAVTGESGSGKSTLAHVLGGILRYEGGELLFGGKPTSHYDSADWERYRRDCVSFISQSYGVLPGSTVLDNVTCALRLSGISREQAAGDAEDILKRVELWDLRRRRAAKLSSGQKQRLSIARALAKPAPVLIADEPTGNLDAENSAMVIKLLAEAAKDRLVILITHEFSEAEDYVTRHIELHDGRITMDAQLREVPQLPGAVPEKTGGKGKKGLSWFVSRFQIKARPVWSALMLCLFALTVFAMFAFAGTFISNLDDTFTYKYDNSAFRNGDPRRIAVAREDGGELTEEDVDKLRSVRYVESVEEYGCVTDIQYAYREGVDYEIQRGLVPTGLFGYMPTEGYTLKRTRGNMPFLRTVPALPDGQAFLTAGRLPENIYEVVAVGGEELLGREITVLLQDQKNWGVDTFVNMKVTVVGVTDQGEHLYFHRDMGRMMLVNARADAEFLYMPLSPDACLVGWDSKFAVARINDTPFYKRIIDDGIVCGKDEAEELGWEMTRSRIAERISQRGEPLNWENRVFGNFKGAPKLVWEAVEEVWENAERWGVKSEPLEAVLDQLGLDPDRVWADIPGYEKWFVTAEAEEILQNRENVAQLQAVCEELWKEAEAAFIEAINAAMPERFSQLTEEEKRAMAERWRCAAPPIHFVQPGEAVVSSITLDRIVRGMRLSDEDMRSWDESSFLTSRFPDIKALSETDFSKLTRAERVAAEETLRRELSILTTADDLDYYKVVLLHPGDFDGMVPLRGSQATVFVEDYAYADRAIKELRGMGYAALSPYQEGAVTQDEELAAQRTQTLRVSLIALLAVIALQILLLRAMFSMETESYRLLSHIGLDCRTAQRSVFWQIMLFALGGQVLGVVAITVCAAGGVDQVVRILRYLPLSYRAVLCLVHLAASAFTAAWTMRALKKQVFPASGAASDLDWDGVDEGVEA